MDLVAVLIVILVLANLVWGFQTGFKGGWPFWVNFIGSVLLALVTFTAIL